MHDHKTRSCLIPLFYDEVVGKGPNGSSPTERAISGLIGQNISAPATPNIDGGGGRGRPCSRGTDRNRGKRKWSVSWLSKKKMNPAILVRDSGVDFFNLSP